MQTKKLFARYTVKNKTTGSVRGHAPTRALARAMKRRLAAKSTFSTFQIWDNTNQTVIR